MVWSDIGEEKAYEIVVTNTNLIADMIEDIQPIPDGVFLPKNDKAEMRLTLTCHKRLAELYGDDTPDSTKDRLIIELDNIREHDHAPAYMIASQIAKMALNDNRIIGCRGSVGSSYVAYLLDISEVNPLEHNIPLEVFTGIDGGKLPDFHFNVEDGYRTELCEYLKKTFGEDKVFKAGTIVKITEKTADGYATKFFDIYQERNKPVPFDLSKESIMQGLIGIKRTTGLHPGTLFIVPEDKDIYDFTPVQRAHGYDHAYDNATELSAHFDRNDLSDTLFNINILSHNYPTLLSRLIIKTNVDISDLRLDDNKVLDLLINTDSRSVPEFDSAFARELIKKTKAKQFDDFVRIIGLAHGSGAWLNNADKLISSGTATLSEVIAFRDDIFLNLTDKGISREISYEIMEDVRLAKGLTTKHKVIMKNASVPEWYIESCEKIEYLFPRAHAVEYMLMAYRIAWFKVYYPEVFYTVNFEIKSYRFPNIDFISMDYSEVKKQLAAIEAEGADLSPHSKSLLPILEMRLEMLERGRGMSDEFHLQ